MNSISQSRGGVGGLGLVVGGVVVLLLAGMTTTPRPKTMAALPDAVVAQAQGAEDTTDAAAAQIAALDLELTTPFDGHSPMNTALTLPTGLGKEGQVELNPRHYGKHDVGTLPAGVILEDVRICLDEHHKGGDNPKDSKGRRLKLSVCYSAKERGFMAVVEVVGTGLCGAMIYAPFEDGVIATRTIFGGSECFVPSCEYWRQKRIMGAYRPILIVGG